MFYEEVDGFYVDDDGNWLTEDQMDEDWRNEKRVQEALDAESEWLREQERKDRLYLAEIEKEYKSGSLEGLFNLAEYYLNDDDFLTDDWNDGSVSDAQTDIIKEAADKGYLNAQKYLGSKYSDRWKNLYKAKYWYEKAGETGDIESLFNLLYIYNTIEDIEEKLNGYSELAFDYREKMKAVCEKIAETGRPDDLVNLALMLIDIKFVQFKTYPLFCKAADKGNKLALYYKGECLLKGDGVEKDEAAAFKCLEQLDEEGRLDNDGFFTPEFSITAHERPGYLKAYCYENGIGTEADPVKAFNIYLKMSKMTTGKPKRRFCSNMNPLYDIRAKYRLALCYKYGRGTDKDIEKAASLLEEICSKDYQLNTDLHMNNTVENPF